VKSLILAAVALTAMALSANAESSLRPMANGRAGEPRALASRPVILAQVFDPEQCGARCQRTHNYCLHPVDEFATGPLRGNPDLLQPQRDRCETNYENCVRNCPR
jgi:hypothetical protein